MRHFIAGAFALFLLAACSHPAPPPPETDEDKTVRWLNDVVGPIDHCAKTHQCSEDTLGKLADKARNFGDDRFAGCGMARRALDLVPAERWTDTQKQTYRDCDPATFLK